MNPLDICLSLPSTIAWRDKTLICFHRALLILLSQNMTILSSCCFSEQSILPWSCTFIALPVSHSSSGAVLSHSTTPLHPSRAFSRQGTDKSTSHTPPRSTVNAKKQPGCGEHPKSALPAHTIPAGTSSTGSQVETKHLSYRNHLGVLVALQENKVRRIISGSAVNVRVSRLILGCHCKAATFY